MNNRIAINMIQSYSCSTQTPNNIYLGSTLIPKVEVVCDGDRINLGIISNTHRHFALLIRQVFGAVPLPVTIPFVVEALSFRLVHLWASSREWQLACHSS